MHNGELETLNSVPRTLNKPGTSVVERSGNYVQGYLVNMYIGIVNLLRMKVMSSAKLILVQKPCCG
jgi:hypothetical protein